MEIELEGLVQLAAGKTDEALRTLAEATAKEDACSFDFGPPTVVKPAHELLGEVLLGLDRAAEAQHEFEKALTRAPRRAASLLGRWRAATRAGDEPLASEIKRELSAMWHGADAPVLLTLVGKSP
jgi:Tfp pilus assembly protein PilF